MVVVINKFIGLKIFSQVYLKPFLRQFLNSREAIYGSKTFNFAGYLAKLQNFECESQLQ